MNRVFEVELDGAKCKLIIDTSSKIEMVSPNGKAHIRIQGFVLVPLENEESSQGETGLDFCSECNGNEDGFHRDQVCSACGTEYEGNQTWKELA
jgi:hypothetical protein